MVATSYGSVYIVQRYSTTKTIGPVEVGGSSTSVMPYGNGGVVIAAEQAMKKVPAASTVAGVFLPFVGGNSMPEGHATLALNKNLTVGAKTFATFVFPHMYEGLHAPRAFLQYDLNKPNFSISGYVDSHLIADLHFQHGAIGATIGEDHGDVPFRVSAKITELTKRFPSLQGEVFAGRAAKKVNLDFGAQARNLVNPYDGRMQPYPKSDPNPNKPTWYAGFGLRWTKPPKQSSSQSRADRSVAAAPVPAQAGSAEGAAPVAEPLPN